MNKEIEKKTKKFEEDFWEHIEASIRYGEVQEPFEALSLDGEIRWAKKQMRKKLFEVVSMMLDEMREKVECKKLDVLKYYRRYDGVDLDEERVTGYNLAIDDILVAVDKLKEELKEK